MNGNTSETIICANNVWRLFRRNDNGVYYADGRAHVHGKHSLGTRDRATAIAALLELDQLVNEEGIGKEGVAPREIINTSIAISKGWKRYIDHRDIPIHLGGLKPSSIRKYSSHSKRFANYCQSVSRNDWTKVDKELLKNYAKGLEGKLAPVTIHDDLTMEISVSSWLIKEGLIPQSCKIDWKLQKPAGAERYCYERDEVTRMLQLALSFKKNRWIYATILILSRTGLRIGEAQNLKWSDVDFKHEILHVRDESSSNISPNQRRHVKDGESRIIPLTNDLLTYFSGVKKTKGYVLTGDQGGQLNYNHIRKAFINQIIEPLSSEFLTPENDLGFKDGRFHSFRHFFVSECFAAGVPESDIRLWVGHSDSKVIAIYRHVRDKIAKANIRKINFGKSFSQNTLT